MSTAAWLVTTQSGRGSGPRQSGSTVIQVVKRCSVLGVVRCAEVEDEAGVEVRCGELELVATGVE